MIPPQSANGARRQASSIQNNYPEIIRVSGLVQGVGFRPHVWHLARELNCQGDVRNDGDGVLIRLWARNAATIDLFFERLRADCPPLARIDQIERSTLASDQPRPDEQFRIIASAATAVHTAIVPDAAICRACAAEISDPANRRYRYPFTNCTHCGPRLSILDAIPYDRANTSMRHFPMCSECAHEYQDPSDRRFHAQPNACPKCGPEVWLEDAEGRRIEPTSLGAQDPLEAASHLLARGQILAIRGIGGFHLACDATDKEAVRQLRQRKARDAKPFALMARDAGIISRYCAISPNEQQLLESPAAPIVLLGQAPESMASPLACDVAPGQCRLGFMLPYTPLHQLLLRDWDRPLVMTSGNLSEEPQSTDNQDARERLGAIADALLLHDRDIRQRLDDSIVRVDAGQARVLRRARGYAPASLTVPPGFEQAPPILALGGELKNTFCLINTPRLILSQHLGDLDTAINLRAFEQTLTSYREIFQHQPQAIAIDAHPDYHSSQFGRHLAARAGLPVHPIQHHFAHIAAVLGEHGWPRDADPVLGLALDGLGHGGNGEFWGGEFLRVSYRGFQRLGWLRPVPLPGGDQAARQPWRNLVAQIHTAFGWPQALAEWPILRQLAPLDSKPVAPLLGMIDNGINAPLSSSAGRLFDAVAAALGIQPERLSYEGQAAMELEALAQRHCREDLDIGGSAYPFARQRKPDGLELDPTPMWQALLGDLNNQQDRSIMAARFHAGLAQALVKVSQELAAEHKLNTIALSGGVFQNQRLLESVVRQSEKAGLRVLSHQQIPSNDGGIALGQALIAAEWLDRQLEPGGQ